MTTATPVYSNRVDAPAREWPSAGHFRNLTPHDADVLRARALTPAVAELRGYRTITAKESIGYGFPALSGLLIPSWNTQGNIERFQLRPHEAPTDPKTGKPRKYLWPNGSHQSLDVPPASTATLTDVEVPLIITESALKADAILSDLVRRNLTKSFSVVAIAGVYGWRSEKMPLSDHTDIPLCGVSGKKIVFRRSVFLAFDSDAATNLNVLLARWLYAEYLRRRGAKVRFIDVPVAPDGGKQGIDDALAAGAELLSLIDAATPVPAQRPVVDASGDELLSDTEQLRARIDYFQRENANLVLTAKNPHLAPATRAMLLNIGTLALSKASRGDVDEQGRVHLTTAEISGDYRPKPEAGESRLKTNPDGSPFLLVRSSVKQLAREARDAGLLNFELLPMTMKRGNGRSYIDHALVLVPPVSLGEFVAPASRYAPLVKTIRKDYRHQEPCPSCGGVHARTVQSIRQTVCGTVDGAGCGTIIEENVRTVTLPIARSDRDTIIDDGCTVQNRQDTAPPKTSTGPAKFTMEREMGIKDVPIGNVHTPSPSTYLLGTTNVAVHEEPEQFTYGVLAERQGGLTTRRNLTLEAPERCLDLPTTRG